MMLRTCHVLCSQAGPSAGGWQPLSFDGGAFHLKGTGELTRALLVLRLCAWPPLVTHGLALQAWSRRLLGSRLSGALLRASIYGQFVAGETAEEVKGCVQQLQTLGLRPLLAVPTEEEPDSAVKTGEAWYEGNFSAMLRCVDLSRGILETPGPTGNILMQLKVTALTSTRLCKDLTSWIRKPGASLELSPERLAEAMDSGRDLQVSCLNTQQNQHLQASLSRLHRVAQHARAQHVRLLVDAEYTFLNPALSLLVDALAMRWNGPGEGGPWVWNTYQAYLKDTHERLRRAAEAADRAGLAFGVKLVRGAYLDKEREVARHHGTEDPTQLDYEATSRSYSHCLELMLTHVSHRGPMCHLMVASHNEESVRQATKRMWELGIPLDGPVCFGQLLGMCDHVSLALDPLGDPCPGAERGRSPQMPSLRSRFPVELGSVRDPEGQVGRLHRLAVAGGPGWGLTRLLRRVVQVDGENSAGQTGLFLSALLGHSCAVQLLLTFGANPNHRCLDGSTPVHAGAFSGRSLVMLHLLQAGGDLRLHDQQGRTPRDWAEQGGAKQSWEVLELLELCRAHISALVHDGELAASASLGQLQAGSRHSLCGSLSLLRLVRVDRAPRPEHIRRPPQIPALGFGQLSSLWPLGLVTGIPLADPKEMLPAQGEPDRTYESSSHTLMANLLWRGHPVTARQLKAPGTQPDVLLADLQHCRYTTPGLAPGWPSPTDQSPACPPDSSVSQTGGQGVWQWPQLQSSPLGQDLARSPPAGAATLPPHCKIVNPWPMLICAQEQPPPCRSGPPGEWPALLPPSTLHHPNLLLLMALSPSADLSGLCLLFEPVWLGSLHVVLHPRGPSPGGPCTVPGLLPGHLLLQVLEALLFLQARWRAHGGLSSHAVQLVRPGLAKVGSLEHGRPLHQRWLQPRSQQDYARGGPGPGLPPPPELYPWLPLELICGDMPAATSDLYSFCILAQEVFTGELPWAGRKGPEVKAKLEAGESPTLDPLVPAPYQALVQAGLGLGPADRWGSLQNTQYLLREAMAQDSAPERHCTVRWPPEPRLHPGLCPL
ncbi:hydroxyproline dehydrogenase isoform X7 [Ursus arctos]|uniref:hydroxyproline dehydrogenase isoform X7 n=1 Tax=Ursus arctos TaxID=9644 RepID=UPI00201728EA|nr:hydroxyproline dehydrogenase isoform X7 [Ursus arctos]